MKVGVGLLSAGVLLTGPNHDDDGRIIAVDRLVDAAAMTLDEPPERGRDPWVFRTLFEDRTRMVLIAAGAEWWLAFNPETAGWHRVWKGTIDLRGKVWDFSQDNSRAEGDTVLAPPDDLLSLHDEVFGMDALDWEFDRAEWDDGGWKMRGDGASITSPVVDLTGWERLYLAFDERSRRGPVRVEIVDDAPDEPVIVQWFDSTMHGTSGTDWQWNFKLITARREAARFRFVQRQAAHEKSIRNVRLFGDRPAWFIESRSGDGPAERYAPEVSFRGYELINRVEGIVLEYDLLLRNGDRVTIEHRVDRMRDADGLEEVLTVRALPEGVTLVHACPQLAEGWRRDVEGGRARRVRDAFGRTQYAWTADELRLRTVPAEETNAMERPR